MTGYQSKRAAAQDKLAHLTFEERCRLSEQCLPEAPYREMLTKMHDEMLAALAQPEFIKHEVENADDWSEWVCPDPKNYFLKCCDCGLVHEAEFGVVRYKSETEDCDIVDDPNLQAVFRMRRSEQWTADDISASTTFSLAVRRMWPSGLATRALS